MTESELLKWALEKLHNAVSDKMYGSITFKLENGRIVSSKEEKSDKPCVDK